MLRSILFVVIALGFLSPVLFSPTPVFAQAKDKKKAEEKVQLGMIASFGNFRKYASRGADTGAFETDGSPSPIGAAISRKGSDCSIRVTNKSEENTYALRFVVEGQDMDGVKKFSKSFSTTVAPGSSESRSVSCAPDWNMAVILKSGRKV